MLKLKYFLADIFILSAEKQQIKSSWRKIEWLLVQVRAYACTSEGRRLYKCKTLIISICFIEEKKAFSHPY
ncbi:hypothetical protein C4H11_12555 [Bacteroides zoogleoformans]|uniref:Uncharacterized protein n=1 Tax=Bacteroides zoogleoformans TaxID=28119 RepID=A0ABN5ILJ3_9BACE|nr:hypothetical protein C4H11_12555 [Bacteroides zoogleoformans]